MLERRRLCSPEERLHSSRFVKTPLGKDLDPDSPKVEVVRQVVVAVASGPLVDDEVASGSPTASVAASLKVDAGS